MSRSSRRGSSRPRRLRRGPRRSRSKRRSQSKAEPTAKPTPGSGGDAVETALRALRHRDRSAAQIDDHLEARGFPEHDRSEALATLTRTGLIDDRRFADIRAAGLADRGAGDALVRHDLRLAGVGDDVIEDALSALAGEGERAEQIVARRGVGAKTARYLAGKGFSEDVVHAVVARARDDALG